MIAIFVPDTYLFRAGWNSLPAVKVRDSLVRGTEPVEFRYRRYSPDGRRDIDVIRHYDIIAYALPDLP